MTDQLSDHADPRYGRLNRDYIATWSEAPTDEPMWALNLMHYRDKADYLDGRESDITGWQADNLYSPIEPLAAVGADIALVGIVIEQFAGDDVHWDRVAIVRYPNRIALAVMDASPEFQAAHVHKEAGMARTIVAATFPKPETVNVDAVIAGAAKSLLLLQFVASAEDTAIVVPGATPLATFDVEGVIIGDGRKWAEARWQLIPDSAVGSVHECVAAAAVSNSYAVLVKPQFGDFVHLTVNSVS